MSLCVYILYGRTLSIYINNEARNSATLYMELFITQEVTYNHLYDSLIYTLFVYSIIISSFLDISDNMWLCCEILLITNRKENNKNVNNVLKFLFLRKGQSYLDKQTLSKYSYHSSLFEEVFFSLK